MSLRAALATGLLLAAAPTGAATVEVEARFDQPVVGLGGVVEFWIEVRSGFRRSPPFEPDFELENLELVGRPRRSESFRFLNGATVRTLRLTWTLQPLGLGEAAVRSIRVQVGEEVYDLPTRHIEVVEQAPPAARRAPLRDPFRRFNPHPRAPRPPLPARPPGVFLRAEVTPEDPWVGQQTVYTLYLLTQTDISAIHPREVPSFQGFWAHEIELPKRQFQDTEMVELDGRRYGRVPLLKRVLFPRRPGVFEVEAAIYDLVAQMASAGPAGTVFDRPQQLRRRSNSLRLAVRALPPPPPTFTGAVGRLALESRLEPRRISVGETTTLTITLTGDGHIQSLPPPQPPELPGVTVHRAEERSYEGTDSAPLSGERSWSFVLVPEHAGSWQLDALEVPYYDPAMAAYRVAASTPLILEVTPLRPEAGDGGAPAPLNPIRSAAVPAGGGTPWGRWLPWLLALPFTAALALRLIRLRAGALTGTGNGGGSPEGRELLARLAEIETGAEASGNRQAARGIEQAWSIYLTERWSLPELPAAQWAEQLADLPGLRPEEVADLGELADEIQYLRQAPQLSSTEALRGELLERSRRLLRKLR